jgi:hypothetical protein
LNQRRKKKRTTKKKLQQHVFIFFFLSFSSCFFSFIQSPAAGGVGFITKFIAAVL